MSKQIFYTNDWFLVHLAPLPSHVISFRVTNTFLVRNDTMKSEKRNWHTEHLPCGPGDATFGPVISRFDW